MEDSNIEIVRISSDNPSFEIKIKDFRSATEPLEIWVEFVHTDQSFQHMFRAVIIPNHVENTECWLAFNSRSARGLLNDRVNAYLCCTVSIIDIEGKSSFPKYFEVQKSETLLLPTKVPKYLKKCFILKREEEFLPNGVLTLRVDFLFDSRYLDGLNEGDNAIERRRYWSKDNYLLSNPWNRRIKSKDRTELQKDTFTEDSRYELCVYDFTCKILKLPQFHEARRRFGVYGIPPEISIFRPEIEEVNPDIFEHVWIFDIKNEKYLHRFLLSLNEREDSVGTRLLHASPVFRRMVDAPMREQQEKRIEFVNISSHLTFFYTLTFLDFGKLKTNDLDDLVHLYEFSHLYEMDELQRKCVEHLVENSEHESELEELERIADHYKDGNLSELLKSRRDDYGTLKQSLFRTDDIPNSDSFI